MLDISRYNKLKKSFYKQNTLLVAESLLGKYLFRKKDGRYLSGIIAETEAYLGSDDPACHASKSKTNRNAVMFEEGGIAYVYFIYGNYYCLNAVTEERDNGCAVLIRALEPVSQIEVMRKNRNIFNNDVLLANGPSKLCLALDIDKRFNGTDLTGDDLFIAEKKKKEKIQIVISRRIGISEGEHLPYRFFIKNSRFVTKHKFNNEIIKEKII